MLVVTDASPLHYLILIGREGALPSLFGQVLCPPGVIAELRHERTPEAVRSWVAMPPPWLVVKGPIHVEPWPKLGMGEREAISLALEMKADFLLIDERRGRLIAEQQHLAAVGVLGVIARASEKGLLELRQSIEALLKTNYRVRPAVIKALLKDA